MSVSAGSLSSNSYEGGGRLSNGHSHDYESFFSVAESKRNGDLKEMLEGSKDSKKLEAMRVAIGLIARGRDVAYLFPAVVKNVLTKNLELKKLVYVYLVRYAEEEQDIALLSISAFQKALKDPNQLIRASALRVLSSIRVTAIAPIIMLSIRESSTDMSSFVRKTAAHAIPKLYSLDPTQKEGLISIIEKLLNDQTTLVAGSAVMAFEIVCPEMIQLIHKKYRSLCSLVVDVDEWGQVAIMNMLTRYARSQFLDPNAHEDEGEAAFYAATDSSEESVDTDEEEEEEAKSKRKRKRKPYTMDQDHRLFLRNTNPLLQSRNSAVVMAVAQVYFHLAPMSEINLVVKPLIRLLHSHREVQAVVLSNIASLSLKYQGLFESHLKSFLIHDQDPTYIRNLKLEILTNIASEASISTILRELQTYVCSCDKSFVAAVIQAIGRCASRIDDVTEMCLAGLLRLMKHQNEAVAAESVVVVKKLLQLQSGDHKDTLLQIAKMAHHVKVPMAKASALWLVGEYSHHVPRLAPDILRLALKSFPSEEEIVKLQVLNLAAKLTVTNPKQSKCLCQYALNLAKYDVNYDIRDRARFLRQLLFPAEKTALSKHAKRLLLSNKPAPTFESAYSDRLCFQVGSLSQMIGRNAAGYQDLPDFPEEAPDPSVRNVVVAFACSKSSFKEKTASKKKNTLELFYSSSSSSDSDEETSEEEDSEDESSHDSEDDEDEESSEEEESEGETESEDTSESSEEEEEEESTDSEEEEEEEEAVVVAEKRKDNTTRSNVPALIDFS